MPWVDKAQARWGNSPAGKKALGEAKVEEFNKATDWKNLPEKLPSKKGPLTFKPIK